MSSQFIGTFFPKYSAKLEKRFNNLTEKELLTINRIIIRCSANFQKFLDDPSVYEISTNDSSVKKDKLQFNIFSLLLNLDPFEIFPPSYFKEKIHEASNNDQILESDTNQHSDIKNRLNESVLSKVFDILIEKGLIDNIRDKKEIKQHKDKIKRREKYEIKGRVSFYKKSDDFQQITKILTNPEAIQFITDSFNQTTLLSDFLKAWFKSTVNNIKNLKKDKDLKQSVSLFVKSLDVKSDMSDWESFIELLSSIDDITLDSILENIAKKMMENHFIMSFIYVFCGSNIVGKQY